MSDNFSSKSKEQGEERITGLIKTAEEKAMTREVKKIMRMEELKP